MKKVERFGLLGLATLLSLFSCQKNEDLSSNVNQNSSPTRAVVDTSSVDKYHIAFVKEDITQKNFGGLGVEWGAYEDTDKIAEGGWDRIIHYMDHLAAARIRLMINYDWFCQNFDNKGNRDPSDDTWTYNFTNKYAKNMIDILEYCQIHHIDVAFGAWNVIGSLEGDIWNIECRSGVLDHAGLGCSTVELDAFGVEVAAVGQTFGELDLADDLGLGAVSGNLADQTNAGLGFGAGYFIR